MEKLTKTQQLKIIEGLCIAFENGDTNDIIRANNILHDIYKIAHLNGTCKFPHPDWHEHGISLAESFNKWGITKVEGIK